MRSGLIASLLTVGVLLTAGNKAEALTLTAADFSCYQSGPCPIAGQNSSFQLWDWYVAVAARDGESGGGVGSGNGSVNLRGNGLGQLNNRLNAGGREVGASTDIGIIFVMGPAFNCLACFLETKDGSGASAGNASAANSNSHLFNRGGWNGTHASQVSGFFSGQGAMPGVLSGGESFVTPEPGTMGLVMVGLALLAGPVRRLLRERR